MEYLAGLGAAAMVIGAIKLFRNDDEETKPSGGQDTSHVPDSSSGVIYIDHPRDLVKYAMNPNGSIIALTADWCGHCKALKPVFEQVPAELAKLGLRVPVVWVETAKNFSEKDLDVEGFPTIRYYRSGKGKEYDGERDPAEIARFVGAMSQR